MFLQHPYAVGLSPTVSTETQWRESGIEFIGGVGISSYVTFSPHKHEASGRGFVYWEEIIPYILSFQKNVFIDTSYLDPFVTILYQYSISFRRKVD